MKINSPRVAVSWILLVSALAINAWFVQSHPRDWRSDLSPGPPPTVKTLAALSLGETSAASYAMMLYVQTFDAQAGRGISIKSLDLANIQLWLERAMEVSPQAGYPLYLASRIYAEVADRDRSQQLLDFIYSKFSAAPNERWPWLAHAAYIARHVHKDTARAIKYARAIRELATGPNVPRWAKDYEIFLLTENDQIEAAKHLLTALLESGQIQDQRELNALTNRLKDLQELREKRLLELATRRELK